MHELPTFLCPHQVAVRVIDAQAVSTAVGTCLGQSHAGEIRIEHILAALPVEDA